MTKNKTILVLTGATLSIGQAYVPAAKPQPTEEVISRYITTHTSRYRFNPELNWKDNQRSEQRKKEILGDIRSIRAQIRAKAESLKKRGIYGPEWEVYQERKVAAEDILLERFSEQILGAVCTKKVICDLNDELFI